MNATCKFNKSTGWPIEIFLKEPYQRYVNLEDVATGPGGLPIENCQT